VGEILALGTGGLWLWLSTTERIGPEYLGTLLPLVTFLIALFAVVALYRRFMKR
jgi:hypothetical protein